MLKFKPTARPKFFDFNQDIFKKWTAPKTIDCIADTCKGVKIKQFDGKLIGRCEVCGYRATFLRPTPIQQLIIGIENKTVAALTGTGLGKTLANAYKVVTQVLVKANTHVLIAGPTTKLINETAKDEMDKFLEESDFVKKTEEEWRFTNGSTIRFVVAKRSAIKSRSVSIIWVVEAQGVSYDFFDETSNRIRNQSDLKRKESEDELTLGEVLEDKGQIIIEANIAPNTWLYEHILQKAHTIIATKTVGDPTRKDGKKGSAIYHDQGIVPAVDKETGIIKDLVVIFGTPEENYYLAPDRIAEMRVGKEDETNKREFYADMTKDYDEGVIFKNWRSCIIHPDELKEFAPYWKNDEWFFFESMDFSVSVDQDPMAYGLFIWNPVTGHIILLEVIEQCTHSVEYEAQLIKEVRQRWAYSKERLAYFVADPAGFSTQKSLGGFDNLRSYVQDLQEYNITGLVPANGPNSPQRVNKAHSIMKGIRNVNELIRTRKLRILSPNYDKIKNSFDKYKYYPADHKNITKRGKPIDLHNHIPDIFRYAAMNLGVHTDGTNLSFYERNKGKIKIVNETKTKKTENSIGKFVLSMIESKQGNRKRRRFR